MKIGVYVGSFNPPHKGHKVIAEILIQKNDVDQIIFIPTDNYWHKQNLISVEHRIKMLKLFASERISVNETLNHLPYTYQILKALQKEHPSDELVLVIGSDNFKLLKKWQHASEILNYQILVINREGHKIKRVNDENIKIINLDLSNYCAGTTVRNMIYESSKITDYIEPGVLEYIKQNKLYEEVSDV